MTTDEPHFSVGPDIFTAMLNDKESGIKHFLLGDTKETLALMKAGCIIHARNEKEIIIIGVDNCIIAEHGGKLLVCKKELEQSIKRFTEQ